MTAKRSQELLHLPTLRGVGTKYEGLPVNWRVNNQLWAMADKSLFDSTTPTASAERRKTIDISKHRRSPWTVGCCRVLPIADHHIKALRGKRSRLSTMSNFDEEDIAREILVKYFLCPTQQVPVYDA